MHERGGEMGEFLDSGDMVSYTDPTIKAPTDQTKTIKFEIKDAKAKLARAKNELRLAERGGAPKIKAEIDALKATPNYVQAQVRNMIPEANIPDQFSYIKDFQRLNLEPIPPAILQDERQAVEYAI